MSLRLLLSAPPSPSRRNDLHEHQTRRHSHSKCQVGEGGEERWWVPRVPFLLLLPPGGPEQEPASLRLLSASIHSSTSPGPGVLPFLLCYWTPWSSWTFITSPWASCCFRASQRMCVQAVLWQCQCTTFFRWMLCGHHPSISAALLPVLPPLCPGEDAALPPHQQTHMLMAGVTSRVSAVTF